MANGMQIFDEAEKSEGSWEFAEQYGLARIASEPCKDVICYRC